MRGHLSLLPTNSQEAGGQNVPCSQTDRLRSCWTEGSWFWVMRRRVVTERDVSGAHAMQSLAPQIDAGRAVSMANVQLIGCGLRVSQGARLDLAFCDLAVMRKSGSAVHAVDGGESGDQGLQCISLGLGQPRSIGVRQRQWRSK